MSIKIPWHNQESPVGQETKTMPVIPAGVRTAVGIFTKKSDGTIFLQDPSIYQLAIASETPPEGSPVGLSLSTAPQSGILTDELGNTHAFAAGESIWILGDVAAGEDVEISASGLDYKIANLSLTTAAAVTDASGSFGVSSFPPGV
jgi:hypothetical protein